MTVLLSIKPKFADKIFNGTKRYEFRKAIFKREDVDRVLVYASSPVQRVIGEFGIESILTDNVEAVWAATKKFAGITYSYYHDYFSGRDVAYAIKVSTPKLYPRKKKLSAYNIHSAPQSFVYV